MTTHNEFEREGSEVTTPRERKDKLEAALGEEIVVEAVRFDHWSQVIASYDLDAGTTTSQSVFILKPNVCSATNLLDVSGWGSSGDDGQRTFRLIPFTCLGPMVWPPLIETPDAIPTPPEYTLQLPINFVATPNSPTPCFLTSQHSFIENNTDVEITVFAWDANGAATPNISFDWRCRVGIRSFLLAPR